MDNWFNTSLIDRGGPVMWVLLAASLFGFIVFIERLLLLHRGQIRTESFLDGIRNIVHKQRLVEALTVCEETPGPVPCVIKAALMQYRHGEARTRRAIEEAALVELPILERRLGALAAIARIGPLLGLLGTVVAVATTFFAIGTGAEPGYPTFGAFLAGVGEALISTATGLLIAIMAHIAHHFLHGRVKALVYDMEYAGQRILQFLFYDPVDMNDPALPPADGPAPAASAPEQGGRR
jgi:biopolymer transport protein ExbB